MKKVLLIAQPAVATDLLINRIANMADEQGIVIEITTLCEKEGLKRIGEFDALVLLPHSRFLLNKRDKLGIDEKLPVGVLDSVDYGNLDAKAILHFIVNLLNHSKHH